MLTSAIALASGVTATVSNALATIFCADEVWEGLREFGGIGALPISADAVVGEGILLRVNKSTAAYSVRDTAYWVTIVRICCGRFPWQLQAEQWARIYLTLAPGSCEDISTRIRVVVGIPYFAGTEERYWDRCNKQLESGLSETTR